jgi:hypothetical protein
VLLEVIVKGYIEFSDDHVSSDAENFASVIDALGKAIEKEFAWLRRKNTFDPLENFIIVESESDSCHN